MVEDLIVVVGLKLTLILVMVTGVVLEDVEVAVVEVEQSFVQVMVEVEDVPVVV